MALVATWCDGAPIVENCTVAIPRYILGCPLMPDDKILERNAAGHFLPGSGGRPPGARNKASRQVLEQIKAMSGDIIQALHKGILAGDSWAVLYGLSKITPSNRTIEFDNRITIDAVIELLKIGEISPNEAVIIADLLLKKADLDDQDNIKMKIIELKALRSNGKKISK
jgi:hypothetical protein